jgi:hypothetical protein
MESWLRQDDGAEIPLKPLALAALEAGRVDHECRHALVFPDRADPTGMRTEEGGIKRHPAHS